jgi:ParB/RepB/Spo0J family partition protein
MATTTPDTPTTPAVDDAGQQITRIALKRIRVGANVRTVTDDDVAAMAGSIARQGQITPVFVYAIDGDADHDYELDGGETRYRALVMLDATHINAIVRTGGRASASAAENFGRTRPNALAEALAIHRMMVEEGLTQAGAPQAAALKPARVAAVLKILDLPEEAQTLVGDGVISLAAVETLLAVGAASTTLLDAVIAHIAKNPQDAGNLARDPGWFITRSIATPRAGKAFAVGAGRVNEHSLESMGLGKKVNDLFAEIQDLERKVLSYAHARVEVAFDDVEVDQARAAGVLLELGRNYTLITDRDLYRELLLTAMNRKKETLTAQLAAKERANGKGAAKQAVSPEEAAERARRAELRGVCDNAHGVNLDIGASLTRGLAEVDPADINVARFLVYALLGHDWDGSAWTSSGERIRSVAAGGIRLVVESLRTDITRTLKGGGRGRLRIDYGTDPQPAVD